MQAVQPLVRGHYYHIYNRGNNRENLFRVEENYRYFLQLYTRHIYPIADTYAYCLLKNHFHLLVRIKTEEEARDTSQVSETCEVSRAPSQSFSNLFNAYTKAINKAYNRTGSLFQERYGRIEVTSDSYFTNLIFYIHYNPQKHGFLDDCRVWPWSSFDALTSSGTTRLCRGAVLDWYGGVDRIVVFHHGTVDERAIQALVEDDLA